MLRQFRASQRSKTTHGPDGPSWIGRCMCCVAMLVASFCHSAAAEARTSQAAAAPGWMVDHYSVDDGLPSNLTTGVAQGPDGALWVSTFDGLARLNGHEVDAVRRSDVPELPGNRFISLVADATGALWALEEHGGLVWLAPGAGQRWQPVPSRGAGRFLQGVAGTAWLAGALGLERLQSGRAEPWNPEVVASEILALADAGDGALWVASANRDLWWVQPHGTPRAYGRAPGASGAPITALAADGSGGVWAGTDGGGLLQFRDGTLHQRVAPNWTSGARPIRELVPGDRGTLQARSDEGWWTLDQDRWQGEPGLAMPNRPAHMYARSLAAGDIRWRIGPRGLYLGRQLLAGLAEGVRQIYLDRQGNLWIAAERTGLYCVRPSSVTAIPLGFAEDQIAAAVAWTGPAELWVVSRTGLLLRSGDRGRHWSAEAPRLAAAALPSSLLLDAQELWPHWTRFGLSATSVLATRGGAVWVGTESGVALWSQAGLLPAEFPWREQEKTLVLSMFADAQGQFWVATPQGLAVADLAGLGAAAGLPGSKAAQWRWLADSGAAPLGDGHSFAQDSRGDLWLTTGRNGLVRISGSAHEFVGEAQGLPNSRLRGLWPQDPATLWVGSLDAGLCRVRLRPGRPLTHARVACLSRAHGLRDDSVHSIAGDGQGRLWLSGNRGITVLSMQSANAVLDGDGADVLALLLGHRHGMVNAETNGFRSPSLGISPQGQLLWPTQDGLALVDPGHFSSPEPPAVALTLVEVDGRRRQSVGGELAVPAGADLTIHWSASEFRWAEQLRFRYRLGPDGPWRFASEQRSATWEGLAPGRHEFEVQAGLGGKWSGPATLSVLRHPTFRETGAFAPTVAGLSLLFAGLAVAGWVRRQRELQRRLEAAVAARTAELRASNRDLTRQRAELAEQAQQLQEQSQVLHEIDQQKSAIISNVSHELRTPLMLLEAPMAQLQAAAAPADRPTFELMRRSADDLRRLVDQLLQAAGLQFGGLPIRAVEQDVSQVLRRLGDQFAPTARAAHLELTLDGPEEAVFLPFDADLLVTAISNLLVNALKFTPAGGQVALGWQSDEAAQLLRIWVADSGPGIDPSHHARIFERFYQVHSGDARPHGGIGLGLSLVKEIIQLHGGSLRVDSALGAGCKFWVEIPGPVHSGLSIAPNAAADPPADPALVHRQPGSEPLGAGPRPTVLIVEDHLDMLNFLATRLAADFEVLTATDGHAALARIAQRRPAAVVSDIMMAGMDGLALCARLRAEPTLRDLPVILISAKGTPRDLAAGLDVAQDYLVKPFAVAELVQRIWLLVAPGRPGPEPAVLPAEAPPEQAAVLTAADRAFVARLRAVMDARLDDPRLSMADLATSMAMSARTLQREVARTTGQRPTDLLNEIRLQRARLWLEAGQFRTLTELAGAVGISPRHLRRLLKGAGAADGGLPGPRD